MFLLFASGIPWKKKIAVPVRTQHLTLVTKATSPVWYQLWDQGSAMFVHPFKLRPPGWPWNMADLKRYIFIHKKPIEFLSAMFSLKKKSLTSKQCSNGSWLLSPCYLALCILDGIMLKGLMNVWNIIGYSVSSHTQPGLFLQPGKDVVMHPFCP